MSRIPELDGIRGIAILLVVITHYVLVPLDPSLQIVPFIGPVLELAWSGVDLFFVLSGFLIGGILLDAKDSDNYFKVFYTRRVCRIFPLYFAWLFLYLLISKFSPGAVHKFSSILDEPFPFWSYFTFTQNIYGGFAGNFGPGWLAPTWSLALEEQFYLLLPFIIRFAPKRWLWKIVLGIALIAPVCRLVIFVLVLNPMIAIYGLLPCRIDTLMVGVLCAIAIRNPNMKQWLEENTKGLYLAFAILLAGLVMMIRNGTANRQSLEMEFYGYTWLALFYASILLLALTEKRGFIRAMANFVPLRTLGIVAYGVYIFHEGVNGLLFGLLVNSEPRVTNSFEVLITLFAFGLTVFLAHLSWKFFEKPIVMLGHRLKYRKDKEFLEAPEIIRPIGIGRFPESKAP